MRGISPVIATVVLVAVTLAIAIAIVGWLFNLWGSLSGGTPMIEIPVVEGKVYTDTNTTVIRMYLKNEGTGSDTLLDYDVIFRGKSYKESCTLYGGDVLVKTGTHWMVKSGAKGWFNITCEDVVLDGPILVQLHFEKSGTMPVHVYNVLPG